MSRDDKEQLGYQGKQEAQIRSQSDSSFFLTQKVERLNPSKTQQQIADQAGYESANMISMLKTGETGVPLEHVSQLARALEVDPTFLFYLALEHFSRMQQTPS